MIARPHDQTLDEELPSVTEASSQESPQGGMREPGDRSEFPPTHTIPIRQWEKACARRDAIRAAFEAGRPYLPYLREASEKTGFSIATLYRCLTRYSDTRDTRSLLDRGKGEPRRSRLHPKVVSIISEKIQSRFLSAQKLKPSEICFDVRAECWRQQLPLPHANTVRNYINRLKAQLGERRVQMKRGNKKMAETMFTPRHGSFNEHDRPGELVQIDHTKLDAILVDEEQRLPIGRAFITVALDVATRMVLGFCISLDPVGTLSTGLCLYHSMLPKDAWLKERDIHNAWPGVGMPEALHFDNAKEFLGKTIQRFCEAYDIRIEHRPLGVPHYGGHIERLIGTLNREIHKIPGTTFSNIQERAEYESEALACMTLRECEVFVAEWITGTYHRRVHTGLGRAPNAAFEKTMNAAGNPCFGKALPRHLERMWLDLLPWEYRTVQKIGITWDKLVYVGEVLGPYTNAKNSDGTSRHFIVARDPRLINQAYFFAPDVNEYYLLKLRNPTRPHLSKWEWDELRRRLREAEKADEDEDAIFASYFKRRQIIDDAASNTKTARRQRERKLHHARAFVSEPPRAAEQTDWSADVEPFEGARVW